VLYGEAVTNKKILDLLSSSQRSYTPLSRLLRQSSLQESWTLQLRTLLPEELAPHCIVRNLQYNTLQVQTTDATWATRLRFQQIPLLAELNKLADFSAVKELRIQVVS